MSESDNLAKLPVANRDGPPEPQAAAVPSANSSVVGRKDGWDKLAALTTLISSVVIGGAGVAATYIYNSHELAIKDQEKATEEKRISGQAEAAHQLDVNRQLEALFKYLASDKDYEREFGYAMYKVLGQEDLALKLIALRRDQAGAAIALSAAGSTNRQTAAQAEATSAILRLRVWLFPAGTKDVNGKQLPPDAARVAALAAWLSHQSGLRDIQVFQLASGDSRLLDEARQKAIADLHIP